MIEVEAIEALSKAYPERNLRIYFENSTKKWWLGIDKNNEKVEWDSSGKTLAGCIEEAIKEATK